MLRRLLFGAISATLLIGTVAPATLAGSTGSVARPVSANQTVGAGSCTGTDACTGATGNIGTDSCNGPEACMNSSGDIGDHSCNDSSNGVCKASSGDIGDGSCTVLGACKNSTGSIGNNACNGNGACLDSTADVGDSSCGIGSACQGVSGDIGAGSCNGFASCIGIGAIVGQVSCNGAKSCSTIHTGSIENNSCNGDHACFNYPGTNVPNSTCNGDHACFQTLGVIYVTTTGAGSKNGSSWANAREGLNSALLSAQDGNEIWVAKGTYFPPPEMPDARATDFVLRSDVWVFGGFAGNETGRSQRDLAANETILSGDIGLSGDMTDNTYHVVTGTDYAVLDGFTISGGNADGSFNAQKLGGGIYNNSSSPRLANLKVTGNSANNGGGIYNGDSDALLVNVTVSGNSASNEGGGIYIVDGAPLLVNVTVSGNVASTAGGIRFSSSVVNIRNSILWGNTIGEVDATGGAGTIANSIISGGVPAGMTNGGGNSSQDPQFVTPIVAPAPTTTGDLHIQQTSPAVNLGYNFWLPAGVGRDIDQQPRIAGGTVDAGSDEWVPSTLPDGQIKRAGGPLRGDNIYNLSGDGQRFVGAPRRLRPGSFRTFHVYVQNDSSYADQFILATGGANVTGYNVSYWTWDGNNITSQVETGLFATPVLQPGQRYGLKVRVDFVSGIAHGSQFGRDYLWTSLWNPDRQDLLGFLLRKR